MADDRVVAADRTTPRQKDQRDRSGVDVVFRLWQCDKKNQGWREGPPLTVPCQSFDLLPGLHPPVKSVSIEKRILLYVGRREAHNQNFGRFKTTIRSLRVPLRAMIYGAMIPPLADVAERRDYGKSRRQVLHRVDQCHWKPPRIRTDPVELLVDASRDRLPELLPIKWARMVASPFGFFRGAGR